jgi:hypothetical protein
MENKAGKELKAIQFKITQEHKEKLAIIQALARYKNASEYFMSLIDEEYKKQMDKKELG